MGYLVVSLIAWGKMTADVRTMKKRQDEMPTKSDLVAAIATMKSDMLTLLDRRKTSRRSEN